MSVVIPATRMPTVPASTTAEDTEIEEPNINTTSQSHLIDYLLRTKTLRAGLDRKSACDILWALTSRDLYWLLALERGWDAGKYEEWLIQVLRDALL